MMVCIPGVHSIFISHNKMTVYAAGQLDHFRQ